MATDLSTSKAPRKFDDFLKRKFADLAMRMQRIDVAAHGLGLVLAVFGYAFVFAIFDWSVAGSQTTAVLAIRWCAFAGFLLLMAALAVKTAFSLRRRVNPYFVAHQLEETLPDAKNGLINWLDLREEELPSAFRKNVGARAAEKWKEADVDKIVIKRNIWMLAGILVVPLLGLLTMFVMDPAGLIASMRRAFLPFYAPVPVTRTTITLLQPEGGDIEVIPIHSVQFVAKIDGRLPAANRPGVPTLHWRYLESDDFLTVPLQPDDGKWTALFDPTKLRSGFTYKITAGDAETPEHRVSVRPRAHVRKFEIAYRHRPFRKLSDSSNVFPNANAATPRIHGPVGTDIEMRIGTSRPVKSASIEFIANKVKKELPVELFKDKTPGFTCRFTLTQPGQFRVVYTAFDGEDNADRDFYPIDVMPDELPRVELTRPGKDMDIPYNGSFILEGNAASVHGIRGLNLRLRVAEGAGKGVSFAPIVYQRDPAFQDNNTVFKIAVEYMEFVALNQLKDDRGNLTPLTPGAVVEYWLEAADGADYPSPLGNIGKSAIYKLKLLDAPVDPKKESIFRKEAQQRMDQHQKKQAKQYAKDQKKDKDKKKDDKGPGGSGGGVGSSNPQAALDKMKKENSETQQKLDNAFNQSQPDRGETKSSDPKPGESKGNQGSADAPDPMSKSPPPMSSNDAGDSKGQSGAGSGDSRGAGQPMKQGAEPPRMGDAKGNEQNGPERPTNDQQNAKNGSPPPELSSKGGGMNDSGSSPSSPKSGPGDPAKESSQARGDGQKSDSREPRFDQLAKDLEKLPGDGPESEAAAKDLVEIAKHANDPRKRELATEMLQKNGRDPATGQKKKNLFGTGSKSPGISDRTKADAANREFAARIGQMQLDDWQKRLTPELLKKAGISDAEWQRFVQNTQDYNAQVRAMNAQIARQVMKQLSGPRNPAAPMLIEVERNGVGADSPGARASSPPELLDPVNPARNKN